MPRGLSTVRCLRLAKNPVHWCPERGLTTVLAQARVLGFTLLNLCFSPRMTMQRSPGAQPFPTIGESQPTSVCYEFSVHSVSD